MSHTKNATGEARERMISALSDMLTHTPIENIIIKELCLRAQVNRSTFYRYYADQYDLLNQVWCNLTQIYLDQVYQPQLSEYDALIQLLHFTQENRIIVISVFRLVLLGRPLPDYADFVRTTLVDRCAKETAPYLQSALVSIIYSWLIKKNPEPAGFIAQLMMDVAAGMQESSAKLF